MRFLFGVLVGVAGLLAAAYFAATSGRISVAATNHGGLYDIADHLLARASDRSVERHAPQKTNPFANDPGAAAVGMAHYKENCLDCHGARDIESEEFAKGLNPAPPMLDMRGTQKMSDGELFWIISNGFRMTGMPAFSPTHSEAEIWKIVAFVHHLPKLTDAEVAKLKEGREDPAEHHKESPSSPAGAGAGEASP
ncbi:MAG: c-type cytochrome [Thermoanaerobaculia bacterium]